MIGPIPLTLFRFPNLRELYLSARIDPDSDDVGLSGTLPSDLGDTAPNLQRLYQTL